MMCAKKWVLVSGGSRGIGKSICLELAKEGYNIISTYLNNKAAADEVITAVQSLMPESFMIQCDMSKLSDVVALGEIIQSKSVSLYGIINNAGITKDNLSVSMTPAEWNAVINTNLNSVFYVNHVFLRDFISEGEDRRIINISSVTGTKGNPGQANYAAAKAALIGMTKTLAVELGPLAVRINTISPGFIETEMTEDIPETARRKVIKQIPLRHIGSVDDVTNMVIFLLGSGGKYITGQNFIIDGGLAA